MRIGIAVDHGGFELKVQLTAALRAAGYEVADFGAAGVPRVLICIEGAGQVEHGGATYAVGKGDVLLLPAVVGVCTFRPRSAVNLLEIELPE